ncbi:MAG: DUF3862 domain-containing protein [Psychrobium sp.]
MKNKLLIAGAVFLLAACGKINKENYDALAVGMDYTEVESLLGNPAECDETLGMKQCQWGDDNKGINVKFVADKVTIYSQKGL